MRPSWQERDPALEATGPTRSQPPPPVPDHKLLRKIGGGSYGEVWLARNILGAYRAVKIVYRGSFDHDRPFEREFAGIQKFEPISRTHESQVDILHVGRGEGYFYYVMELADDANVDGLPGRVSSPGGEGRGEGIPHSSLRAPHSYVPRTLKLELQRRGRMPFDDCLQIGLALTTALAHLHKHGLVHRDIKPSNIIFVNGRAKLADIGLVTSVDATRSFVGTEGYLAPEGPGTPQGDIYSLGKVLYEMGTGQDRRHFPVLPPEIAQLPDQPQLSELNSVVVKACQHDPKLRYSSAEAMEADLARLQAGRSVRRQRTMERRWAIIKKVSMVAAALALVVATPSLVKVLKQERAPNLEAVRLYKLGRWHQQQLTDQSLRKAIEYLEQAIQIDSNYAAPYVTLFELNSWQIRDDNQLQKNRQIASRLMAINPKLAEAHTALSWVKYGEGDWEGAESEVKRAIELNPNYAAGHSFYAYYLSLLGRADEAKQEGRRAMDLDPDSRIHATVAGFPFVTAHEFDKAAAQFRIALDLDQNFALAHTWLGKVLQAQGQYKAAIDQFEKSDLLDGEEEATARTQAQTLREAFTQSGPYGYWHRALELEQIAETRPAGTKLHVGGRTIRWSIPGIYAQLGNKDEALRLLQKEYAEGGRNDLLKLDPLYAPLRDDPRFKRALRNVGLEK